MVKIGWIGIGHMGKNMARRVLQAGYTLHILMRTPRRCRDWYRRGRLRRILRRRWPGRRISCLPRSRTAGF